jgi:hypothetical protein
LLVRVVGLQPNKSRYSFRQQVSRTKGLRRAMRLKSVSSGILCAGVLVLMIPLYVSAQEQRQNRILNWFEGKPVPETKVLEIVEIKVEGKPVRLGESFSSGRDWFKTLAFTVKNISAKPIKTVIISFNVPELDADGHKNIWDMRYQIMRVGVSSSGADVWEYVPPGGEIDLRFTEKLLNWPLHKSLDEINGGANEVRIVPLALVTFTDGSDACGGFLTQ